MFRHSAGGVPVGRIELIIGPMMCGKTEELCRRIRHELIAGRSVVVVKHSADGRFGDGATSLATHSGERIAPGEHCAPGGKLSIEVADTLGAVVGRGAEVIGIDEGQFFPDLVSASEAWAAAGARVIVSALDGTSDAAPFGEVCNLLPKCESVDKLSGVCMLCRGRPSTFSVRIDGDRARCEVGGAEKYRSVCRGCRQLPPN